MEFSFRSAFGMNKRQLLRNDDVKQGPLAHIFICATCIAITLTFLWVKIMAAYSKVFD